MALSLKNDAEETSSFQRQRNPGQNAPDLESGLIAGAMSAAAPTKGVLLARRREYR
jgi:hypothetical protein